MNWDYLDKMDKNLLYFYVKGLSSKKTQYSRLCDGMVQNYTDDERSEMIIAEQKCKMAFYIIWFVYRYVLECKDLQEAKQHMDIETLKKYKIAKFLHNKYVYIGVYGIDEVYLYEDEIHIILEILYNRYDFFEQLECYLRESKESSKRTQSRCIRTIEQSLEMMKGKPEYKEIVQKYNERKGIDL
jgi:hypothetical protein